MTIVNRFSKYLNNIEYPEKNTYWNISGTLKNQNRFYKFDVRDMFKLTEGNLAQKSTTLSKADKMVLEFKDKWIILDLEELHKYIKNKRLKKVYLKDLLSELEWNIILKK